MIVKDNKTHYLILGSSAASLACAMQLKRLDQHAHIAMLTAQSERPNNTCLLADYVAGKRTKQQLYLPTPAGIEILYNSEVVCLDAQQKKVVTQNGHEYFYDKLFIGTGLKPHIPAIFRPYLNTKVFLFKSLGDITAFEQQEHAFIGKRVLVVGGGITGIEASEALFKRGYSVTLCEKSDRLLPQFDAEVAQEIAEILQQNNIKILLNYTVTGIDFDRFDTIFLATGGKPATDFLDNQIDLDNNFIVVNTQQQTSCPDIYAGGDVCVGRSLWPQALVDGRRAAYRMMGIETGHKDSTYPVTIRIFEKNIILKSTMP